MGRQALFEPPGGLALHRREDEVDRAGIESGCVEYDPLGEGRGQRLLAGPALVPTRVGDRVRVRAAGAPRARRQRRQLEPRVAIQGNEELLPGDASRTQDGDSPARHLTHVSGSLEGRDGTRLK